MRLHEFYNGKFEFAAQAGNHKIYKLYLSQKTFPVCGQVRMWMDFLCRAFPNRYTILTAHQNDYECKLGFKIDNITVKICISYVSAEEDAEFIRNAVEFCIQSYHSLAIEKIHTGEIYFNLTYIERQKNMLQRNHRLTWEHFLQSCRMFERINYFADERGIKCAWIVNGIRFSVIIKNVYVPIKWENVIDKIKVDNHWKIDVTMDLQTNDCILNVDDEK